jgi:hypothetical protein
VDDISREGLEDGPAAGLTNAFGPPTIVISRRSGAAGRRRSGAAGRPPLTDNLARLRRGWPRRHTLENSDVNPYFDSIFAIGSSPRSRAAMASVQAVSPG